jgi:CheY-like chemotaxis protein
MKKKILIVEDDQALRQVLKMHLDRLGYDSILAVNGKEAAGLATSQVPDLILMDLTLPVMDGLEATRLIREHPNTQATPIIAMTARVTSEDKIKCLQNGCDGHIAKPFTTEQLASIIKKLLKQDNR